jgi:hypothetical protein
MTPTIRTTSLILAAFALVCAIMPAAASVPSAIAQEDLPSVDKDLARSIVTAVLDGGDNDGEEVNVSAPDDRTNQDSMNAAIVNPNQEDKTVDQTDFNEFGDNTVTNLDTDQTESHVGVSIDVDEEEEDDKNGAVWCYQRQGDQTVCFNTHQQCELALAENDLSTTSHCERSETLSPDAFLCVAKEGGISCIRE